MLSSKTHKKETRHIHCGRVFWFLVDVRILLIVLGHIPITFPCGAGTGAVVFCLFSGDAFLQTPEFLLARGGFPRFCASLLIPGGRDSHLRTKRIIVRCLNRLLLDGFWTSR